MAAHDDPDGSGTATAVVDPPPAPGPPPERSGGLPTWARRLVIGLVLALAVGVLWLGSRRNVVGDQVKERDPAVLTQIPAPDSKALRQTQVGAELAQGYNGRLTINGVAIPEAEMEGAVNPAEVSAADIEKYGIRPNNHHRVFFTPGPGKVIEEFDTGPVTIVVSYYKDGEPLGSGRSISWIANVD